MTSGELAIEVIEAIETQPVMNNTADKTLIRTMYVFLDCGRIAKRIHVVDYI
jgi:hypothetical protein